MPVLEKSKFFSAGAQRPRRRTAWLFRSTLGKHRTELVLYWQSDDYILVTMRSGRHGIRAKSSRRFLQLIERFDKTPDRTSLVEEPSESSRSRAVHLKGARLAVYDVGYNGKKLLKFFGEKKLKQTSKSTSDQQASETRTEAKQLSCRRFQCIWHREAGGGPCVVTSECRKAAAELESH